MPVFNLYNVLFSLASISLLQAHRGTSASPADVCGSPGATILRAGEGLIVSPSTGWPRRYPNNANCQWTLVAPRSRRIALTFAVFDVQSSKACGADYVKVVANGGSHTPPSTATYCGNQLPQTIVSPGHTLQLSFVTDNDRAGEGFNVSYSTVGPKISEAPMIVWLEQNLSDKVARLQSFPAKLSEYLNSSIATSTILRHQPAKWTALAADYHEREFFWADDLRHFVWRGVMDGNKTVASPMYRGTLSNVTGLAVDWLAKTVYWTDAAFNWIMVSNYDGSRRAVVVEEGLDRPSGIAVHPLQGFLFWTDKGSQPRIERSSLDGGDRRVLVTMENIHPVGITVDFSLNRLYWTAHDLLYDASSIYSMTFDGESVIEHIRIHYSLFALNDITIFQEYLFVTDSTNQLHCYFKDGVRHYLSFDLSTRQPFGITTYARSRQVFGPSGCDVMPCEYLCVGDKETAYRCVCQLGHHALENGSCVQDDVVEDKDTTLEFTSQPHNVTIVMGATIEQTCSSNQPSASVQWLKDFEPLPIGQSDGVYVLTDGALLIIEADERSRGLYTCVITGDGGAVLRATVEFKFDQEAIFSLSPESATIPEGETYLLVCSTVSPSHVIRWQKNQQPLQLSDMIHVISGDNLIIRNALVSDSGIYTCSARTLEGVKVAEASAEIIVSSRLVAEEVCGRVTSPEAVAQDNTDWISARIVGGTTAKRGSAPWMVRLWLKESRKHICGGTLLNREWVLTAAHCITTKSLKKEDISIRLGDHDSYYTEDSEILVGVQLIKVHNNYIAVDPDYDSDIALIKLADPVDQYSDYLRPICLPPKKLAKTLLVPGTEAKVVGWGKIAEGGPYPRYLTEVTVPVVWKNKCSSSTIHRVTDNMFCAGYKREGGDSCNGDSGGPLAVAHEGRWYQLGIVSWGEGCNRPGKYGFYTKLSKFVNWINQYMDRH